MRNWSDWSGHVKGCVGHGTGNGVCLQVVECRVKDTGNGVCLHVIGCQLKDTGNGVCSGACCSEVEGVVV